MDYECTEERLSEGVIYRVYHRLEAKYCDSDRGHVVIGVTSDSKYGYHCQECGRIDEAQVHLWLGSNTIELGCPCCGVGMIWEATNTPEEEEREHQYMLKVLLPRFCDEAGKWLRDMKLKTLLDMHEDEEGI